ncbi:leucine-rich repeat domain-containing protein [Saccharospirillum salsuginis]|uniref:leucine-rich repeat domain-containing protein n=1 Tax=Saccharospirillum salsuginis TaxID=418750 RepID=UPI0016754CF4|nr:hypothetical protein [Saccharospirillum salsuginis]
MIDLVNARPVSLAPLGDLPKLRVLRLHHTNPHSSPGGALLDLSVLRQCPQLTVVELPRQNVRALDGLEGHKHLHTVDVSSTRVADLGPLAGLPTLTVLRLRHTRVTTLAPLASVPTLEELDVAHTAVADISVLRELPAVTTIDLRATLVIDLKSLVDIASLRRVVVQRLQINDAAIDQLRKARPEIELIT